MHHSGVATFIKLSRVKEEVLFDSVTLTKLDEGFQVVDLKRRNSWVIGWQEILSKVRSKFKAKHCFDMHGIIILLCTGHKNLIL